jgi:hypothetical protein
VPAASFQGQPLLSRLSTLVAALSLSGCAPPAIQATAKLDAAACRQARVGETRRLPATWSAFLAHVKICEVADGGGKTPLTIATISATDYYASLPDGTRTVDLPKPILFNTAGENVGTLPFTFPDDPPFSLDVIFGRWASGWPERIDLFLHDPTVSGDRPLDPLVWNAAARRFVSGLGK